jgi:hypothetical protein
MVIGVPASPTFGEATHIHGRNWLFGLGSLAGTTALKTGTFRLVQTAYWMGASRLI